MEKITYEMYTHAERTCDFFDFKHRPQNFALMVNPT